MARKLRKSAHQSSKSFVKQRLQYIMIELIRVFVHILVRERKVLTDGTTRGISHGRRRIKSAAEAAECRPQRRSESDQQALRTVPGACLQWRDVGAFRPALGFGLPSPAAPRGAETDGPPVRASDGPNDSACGRKKNDSTCGAASPGCAPRGSPLTFPSQYTLTESVRNAGCLPAFAEGQGETRGCMRGGYPPKPRRRRIRFGGLRRVTSAVQLH